MTTLNELGERKIIDLLRGRLPAGRDVRVGIGDDAAVVASGGPWDWVLTSDPVIEGSHFLPGENPRRIGHKAAGRALSDLGAMGADPLWLLVNVVAPPDLEAQILLDIYDGAAGLLDAFGAAIIGGDVARGRTLELHVFAAGRLPAGSAVLRSGARPGDALYVTGALGGSLLGKHLDFTPRVREGTWLREGGWATAMIDVSDGLLSESYHLARGGRVGITLSAESIPVSGAAEEMARADRRTPLDHALRDGEDFELLFTVPDAKRAAFELAWQAAHGLPCTRIGEVTAAHDGVWLRDQEQERPLPPGGFEHFAAGQV